MTKEKILEKRELCWFGEEVEMKNETSHIKWEQCLMAMDENNQAYYNRCIKKIRDNEKIEGNSRRRVFLILSEELTKNQ